MIIQDTPRHKIDLEFTPQGPKKVFDVEESSEKPLDWVRLTVFNARSDTEWETKSTGISPETAIKMSKMILEHYKKAVDD